MVFYKIYIRDKEKGDVFLGVLPERRRNPRRITHESVTAWVKKMPFGAGVDAKDIFFIQVEM